MNGAYKIDGRKKAGKFEIHGFRTLDDTQEVKKQIRQSEKLVRTIGKRNTLWDARQHRRNAILDWSEVTGDAREEILGDLTSLQSFKVRENWRTKNKDADRRQSSPIRTLPRLLLLLLLLLLPLLLLLLLPLRQNHHLDASRDSRRRIRRSIASSSAESRLSRLHRQSTLSTLSTLSLN